MEEDLEYLLRETEECMPASSIFFISHKGKQHNAMTVQPTAPHFTMHWNRGTLPKCK